MKKGAIFDMDGLMFDSEAIWQKNWHKAADKRNIVLDPGFAFAICGTSGDLMRTTIEKFFGVEDGTEIMQEVIHAVHDDLAEGVPEKPGIHEILEMFKRNGVRMAVASSSSKELIERNLKNTGTDGYIEAIVSGVGIAHGKPAPDIFLLAAEQLQMDPRDCYVFEDAFNGVKSGYAAGCTVIMIPDISQPTEEIRAMTAGVFDNLLEASEAIESGKV